MPLPPGIPTRQLPTSRTKGLGSLAGVGERRWQGGRKAGGGGRGGCLPTFPLAAEGWEAPRCKRLTEAASKARKDSGSLPNGCTRALPPPASPPPSWDPELPSRWRAAALPEPRGSSAPCRLGAPLPSRASRTRPAARPRSPNSRCCLGEGGHPVQGSRCPLLSATSSIPCPQGLRHLVCGRSAGLSNLSSRIWDLVLGPASGAQRARGVSVTRGEANFRLLLVYRKRTVKD